jgi:hypothetical protein
MRLRVLICVTLVAALSVAVSSSAIAAGTGPAALNAGNDPSQAQYGDQLKNIAARTGDPGDGGPSSGASSNGVLAKRVVSPLPFTGLDLISLTVVALALLGTGLIVRRVSSARHARSLAVLAGMGVESGHGSNR